MIHDQNTKAVPLALAAIGTSATAAYTIDRAGFNTCAVEVQMAAASATNSAGKWAVLKLAEGDTTAVSSSTDIAAFVGSTNTSVTTGFVIPANNTTSAPQQIRLFVDCRPRRRYLFVIAQPHATNNTGAITAYLGRASITPDTDTERGAAVTVVG